MKIELYCVKDTLVGFSQPFACVTEAVALRQFAGSAVADCPNVVNTFPEHKELWKVGSIDDQTGILESDVKFIAKALDYVKSCGDTTHEEENNQCN